MQDAYREPFVSVVIPTLNEAENLPHLLPRLAEEYEVIVVDGGSTDGTPDIARSLRPDARVARQSGRGKGDALLCGFLISHGDIIVTLDADGSADVDEIPRFVEALKSGADYAKGSRFLKGGGSADLTLVRGIGNRLLGTVVNRVHGTSYTDLCYGFNAFWRHCLPQLIIIPCGFEIETLMNIRIARAGMRVVEIPSYEERRRFGHSNLHAVRDGFRILRVIWKERPPAAGLPDRATP
jgi:glycosyltransferase involved in cell wall biosynthesis